MENSLQPQVSRVWGLAMASATRSPTSLLEVLPVEQAPSLTAQEPLTTESSCPWIVPLGIRHSLWAPGPSLRPGGGRVTETLAALNWAERFQTLS